MLYLQRYHHSQGHLGFHFCYFLGIFIVLHFTLHCMTHFELLFVKGVKSVWGSFFCTGTSTSLSTFVEEYLLSHIVFTSLSEIIWLQFCGSISGFSILFHWPAYLFFCQYHAVLITVALQYLLKLGCISPPIFFF